MATCWDGAYSPDSKAMAMHRAAKAGDTSSVLSYIAEGTDVDARDSLEATCLYWAVSKHHENLVAALLDRGADANAKTKWGSTALHAASDRGFLKMAETLLEYGASSNIVNGNEDTPLHMACMRGHLAVIRLLVLNGGAELTARNQQGRTPLAEADSNEMIEAASFLKAMMENANRRQGLAPVAMPVTCEPMTESMGHISLEEQSDKSGQFQHGRISNEKFEVAKTAETKIQPTSAPKENSLHREKFEILRLDHQRLVQEKAQVEEELRITKGDCQAVRQKLKFCQTRLEETSTESEELRKQTASLTLQLHAGMTKPKVKSKVVLSQGAAGQSSRMVLQPAMFAGLLEAVSVEKFQVAQGLLASCIKLFEMPYESLRQTLTTKAGHQWELNKDFEIIGDGPFNRKLDGLLEGSCSLVFRIRHVKFGVLVLKMMNNLINMLQSSHGVGFSGTPWLRAQFGAEHDVPLTLPPSPYVLPVIHHYQGSTASFHQYLKFLVPQQFDVPLEMASTTTFLVMPEYETTLEKWIIEQKRQYSIPPFGVEEWEYLLIIYQLLCGIHHLITNSVVHRDLKASNILMSGWEVVIADFGFARRVIKSANSACQSHDKHKQIESGYGLDANNAAVSRTNSLSSLPVQRQQLKPTAAVEFVEKTQVFAGNAHAWAPELARWSRSGPPNTATTQLTLLDIYAKSDTFAIGRMFFNLLREPPSSSPNSNSWNDEFPGSSMAKPHYSNSEIPELPSCYSNSLHSLLKNMVLNEPSARKETLTLIHVVGLMLWGPPSNTPLMSVDDCCQWILKEQLEMAMCEDNDYSSLSLAGQSLTSRQFSIELKKRFVCEAQPQVLWNAFKTLALFSSCV